MFFTYVGLQSSTAGRKPANMVEKVINLGHPHWSLIIHRLCWSFCIQPREQEEGVGSFFWLTISRRVAGWRSICYWN